MVFTPGPQQQEIIAALQAQPTITPAKEITSRVDFLAEYLTTTGAAGYVLGISGGQDSTLAGRLTQLAVEKLRAEGRDAAFWGMRLPHGQQVDEDDARLALDFIDPDHEVTVNIQGATAAMAEQLSSALDQAELDDFNRGNIKARQRMIAQYGLAGERGLLVVGSDHAAENLTAFFTKHGDGAADIMPLTGLNKRQGAALLKHLNAPSATWEKVPTADLEEGRPALPDEQALGVSYQHIDDYLEGLEVPAPARERIEHLWRVGQHKRHLPPGPADSWWRG